jgi:hypothetical protein
MRSLCAVFVLAGLGLVGAGCTPQPKSNYEGPKITSFTGKVVADGKPVTFTADQKARIQYFHDGGSTWGIPLSDDGSWKIGWMPTGHYSGFLERANKAGKGLSTSKFGVPDLEIVDGQTDYVIDLGKNFK